MLLLQSQERLRRINSPMTRSEFVRQYGRSAYEKTKWRWVGAKRGERR